MSGDQLDDIWGRSTRALRGLERMPIDVADILREDVPALVAEVRRLRALSDRLRDQLQHECPHGEMSWSGVDQTPLEDPAKVWACDNCGAWLADAP